MSNSSTKLYLSKDGMNSVTICKTNSKWLCAKKGRANAYQLDLALSQLEPKLSNLLRVKENIITMTSHNFMLIRWVISMMNKKEKVFTNHLWMKQLMMTY